MQSEAPPPPVLSIPAEGEASFAEHPIMVVDGKRFIVFALSATGSAAEIEAAREKLSAAGWATKPGRTSTEESALTILAKGKSGAEIKRLTDEIRDRQYGGIEALPFIAPAPETLK